MNLQSYPASNTPPPHSAHLRSIRRFSSIFGALLLVFGFASSAQADLVWQFVDDGSGNIREILSGSIDVSGGADPGGNGAGNGFGGNETLGFLANFRYSMGSPAGGGSSGAFMGAATNPGQLINSGWNSVPSGWGNADMVLLRHDNNNNLFEVFAYDGPFANGLTSINEDSIYNVSYSSLNEGVWTFGNTTDLIEGNGVTLIVGETSAVPEPSSCILFGLGGLGLLARRKRKAQKAKAQQQ